MGAHRRHLVEARTPIGDHPIGMVVRRIADRLVDMTSERGLRDIARAIPGRIRKTPRERAVAGEGELTAGRPLRSLEDDPAHRLGESGMRSEEHTSELQSLMRISYAVFCLTK